MNLSNSIKNQIEFNTFFQFECVLYEQLGLDPLTNLIELTINYTKKHRTIYIGYCIINYSINFYIK
jgi:hypothetical protein